MDAIGQILECPKCGSFVQITPPVGWQPDEDRAAVAPVSPPPARPTVPAAREADVTPKGEIPAQSEPAGGKPAVEPPPVQAGARPTAEAEEPLLTLADPTAPADAGPANTVTAPPLAPAPAALPPVSGGLSTFTPFKVPEVVAGRTFLTALVQSAWGRALVLAVSAALGLAGVLAAWAALSKRPQGDVTANGDPANPAKDEDAGNGGAKPAASPFHLRWLPQETAMLIDLRLSRLVKQPQAIAVLDRFGQSWRASAQLLLDTLNLPPDQVRQLTWAATDLADLSSNCLVVVELEEGVNAVELVSKGDEVDLGRADLVGRRLPGAAWSRPFVAVDPHTIVTGDDALLRQVVARNGDAALASLPMKHLQEKLSPDGDLAILLDLPAARNEVWQKHLEKLNAEPGRLEVWPAGKSSWRRLCETPLALGLSIRSADEHRLELGLACEGEVVAERLRIDAQSLMDAALRGLPDHIAELKKVMRSAKVPAEAAELYERLLDGLLTALRTVRCESADGVVWVRFRWGGQGLLAWLMSAIENDKPLLADWLSAALAADEMNHRLLLKALLDFVAGQSPPKFPAGVAGDVASLPPETRLSWIADLLPFLGHPDWRVRPGYSWNSKENQPFAKRTLPEVVNPALGPSKAAGYPVTHYVGLAGVGKDAADLPATDPRAGVFGFRRRTGPKDFVRGNSHTIAVLGVTAECGPWAQGGPATVRALTRQPYVNGPDGFGSGQVSGMVAGMADGAVRFISKDVDPHVLEQLATLGGGDLAALSAKPDASGEKPPPAHDVKPPANDVKPKPVEVKPPPVDPKVQARLNDPIRKLSLSDMPLANAVQLISAMSTLPVSFDPDAMEELGVTPRDLVRVEVADATVAQAMEKIAAAVNMAMVVEQGQIVLTSSAEHRGALRPRRYAVSDLTLGDARAAADLAQVLQTLVVPQSWQAGGGQGTVEVSPDALRVVQTGHVHHQVLVFCEKLRVARGLAPKSGRDPRKFALATRTARARDMLGRFTSVQVSAATPLESALAQFKHPTGTEIFIDCPALAAAGIAGNATKALKIDNRPQGEALRQLLEPMGLAWRAVDADVLQVTTQKAVAARMELEFFPVGKLLAGQPPAALIEKIKAKLPGAAWGAGGGALHFDPASQSLIVLQSQPVQMAVESLLGEK